jgi:hypothetical protein
MVTGKESCAYKILFGKFIVGEALDEMYYLYLGVIHQLGRAVHEDVNKCSYFYVQFFFWWYTMVKCTSMLLPVTN